MSLNHHFQPVAAPSSLSTNQKSQASFQQPKPSEAFGSRSSSPIENEVEYGPMAYEGSSPFVWISSISIVIRPGGISIRFHPSNFISQSKIG
ncbi:hypothetical protein L2E82_47122 [Cichorium intybus]|uniref:Uncharacterized protein n=1 Tax=Cichorium intybus TaxID=13427 RepID=A0ACB8YV78_CICIN|nr:hypothetical protein L2E82_47122 [Cichorium intybus]